MRYALRSRLSIHDILLLCVYVVCRWKTHSLSHFFPLNNRNINSFSGSLSQGKYKYEFRRVNLIFTSNFSIFPKVIMHNEEFSHFVREVLAFLNNVFDFFWKQTN